MTGAEIVFKALEDQEVKHIFGYPGGAVLPIYDELKNHKKIKHILVRHEQGAGHAAEGYARSSGKPGVMLVTSGPGATNAVTALTDAYMDSIPLVCITGQVPTHLIGTDAFQECDTTGITRPCTKHNWLVKDIKKLSSILHKAFDVDPNTVWSCPSSKVALRLIFKDYVRIEKIKLHTAAHFDGGTYGPRKSGSNLNYFSNPQYAGHTKDNVTYPYGKNHNLSGDFSFYHMANGDAQGGINKNVHKCLHKDPAKRKFDSSGGGPFGCAHGNNILHNTYFTAKEVIYNTITNKVNAFVAAKEVAVIDSYAENLGIEKFDLAIDWGWFYFIVKPLFFAIDYFFKLTGNFGWAIVIITALVRLIFLHFNNNTMLRKS